MLCPVQAVSIESAITSRETREYFMPFCAHRNAVADGDGAELLGHGTGGRAGLLLRVAPGR